jgi:DNA excision repair protein ERCC-4
MGKLLDFYTIVIDRREQKPYEFETGERWGSIRGTLKTGDYSILGLEDKIAIERKSLEDFVSTIIHANDRFAREVYRSGSLFYFAIVVEASVEDIALGRYRSRAHPQAVLARVASLSLDCCIPIFFCKDRAGGREMTQTLLKYAAKKLESSLDNHTPGGV